MSIRAALGFLGAHGTSGEPQWSIYQIALEHDIAAQTFRRAVAKDTAPNRPGSPTVELVDYCLNMQKLGFGLSKPAVNTLSMRNSSRKASRVSI
jgi:hypothetical protein